MVDKTDAEKSAEYMKITEEYKKTPDSDGIYYTASTAQAIAYERMLESNREDALFKDPLAKHLVGERGEKVSEIINFWISSYCLPTCKDIHIRYTAARTHLINQHMTAWVTKMVEKGQKVQIASLGAGMDTRAYWVEGLKQVERYVEVDVKEMNDLKTKKLAESDAKPFCERQVISMDF